MKDQKPGCPNAEAPKVGCICTHSESYHSSEGCIAEDAKAEGNFCPCLSDHAAPAPAPEPKYPYLQEEMDSIKSAPEPKQGSAMKPRCAWEPGTPGECSAYLALRAELTQAEKACALALDYVQGSPRPRHMDVVSALREVIARAKEGEKR